MASSDALRARVIAFYLPQFHPIPENDSWWGPGFTEWTNVAGARPLFHGHRQPNLPGELGFYDLRLPETRAAQADLARAHGVEAFCYWHYWFAGERLLERPFEEVLASGEPDFPFCLAWANQSWTGIWHGAPGRLLKEQTYPGAADDEAHFYNVLRAFRDERYVRVNGLPLFCIYRPTELPRAQSFLERWRSLAEREGLAGIVFAGVTDDPDWRPADDGFDLAILHGFSNAARSVRRTPVQKITKRLSRLSADPIASASVVRGKPATYDYSEVRPELVFGAALRDDQAPAILPNWDNTPRAGRRGLVLHGATPALFGRQIDLALGLIRARPLEERLLFVKSWNEWAEGNYLEPDRRFGREWLEVLRDRVGHDSRRPELRPDALVDEGDVAPSPASQAAN